MIYGFAINTVEHGTIYGVISASSEVKAQEVLTDQCSWIGSGVTSIDIIDAEDAIYQYDGVMYGTTNPC